MMESIWKEIYEELLSVSPEIAKSFNNPAIEDDISQLEQCINQKLPESFIEYLHLFNGQEHNNFDITFVGYNSLLPVKEIIEDWSSQVSLFSDEPIIDFIVENKVQPKIWDINWIPFACFEGDSRLIIDLNPGRNGLYGQILQIWSGTDLGANDIVIASSFHEFSEHILAEIKSKNFDINEGCIVLNTDWLI